MQTTFLIEHEKPIRLKVRELPPSEWPVNRLHHYGADSLSTLELLAAIIQTPESLSQAGEMLARFDGLQGIQRASEAELTTIDGIGPSKAAQIKAALELGRRALSARNDKPQVRTPSDIANLVLADMQHLTQEELWVINLDIKNYVLKITKLYRGNINTSLIRASEVFKDAVTLGAAAIVVVHNHPSGDPTPSPEDVASTEVLVKAGRTLDIELLDHIIIGQQRYVSLKERGLGFS